MTVWLTKVWDFVVPCGPLQFSTEGWRDRVREELEDGDLVVAVGTKGDETAPEDRGRLLGMMAPTKEPVLWTDFPLPTRPIDFREDGTYRWPFALLNRRAWIFKDRPRPQLEAISSRPFGMDAVSGIARLTSEEAAKVERLQREEIELLVPVRARARIEGEEVARRRSVPSPTTKRTGIMHYRRAPAYTYVMGIVGATEEAYKVGWAFDFRGRQRQFNLYAMPGIGGLRYQTRLSQLWDTAREAFRMEQTILRRFGLSRHRQNSEILYDVKLASIQRAWIEYIRATLQ